MMNATPRRAEIVVMLFALVLPFKAGGCGSTTCITLTQAQLDSGTCPSQQEAQMKVTDPNNCFFGATVTTIEGAGERDGELCCYPSSKTTQGGEVICMGVGGGVTTTSFESTGFGGGTTGGGSCNSVLHGAPFDQLSGQSQVDFQNLQKCGCNMCTAACDPSLCLSNAPEAGCTDCLLMSCATELTACQND